MKPIVCKDTSEEYFSKKDFLSSSALVKYKDSPLHFLAEEPKKSDALDFGTMYHCYVLEPERFNEIYYVYDPEQRPLPQNTFQKKENKEWLENLQSQHSYLIEKSELETLELMKKRLFSNNYVRYLFKNGQAELSHYTEFNGVKVKVRTDWKTEKVIIDLKTIRNASKNKFIRDAVEYNYHVRAAFYLDIVRSIDDKKRQFLFLAQEKHYPYAFNLFRASEQFLAVGRYEYEQILEQYKYCLENGIYEGYSVFCDNIYGITEINVPPYKIKELIFYNTKK